MAIVRRWFWNVLIAFDQFWNAVLFGDPDETISSRAYKRRDRWPWSWLIAILDYLDPGHGERALEVDEGKDGAAQ